MSDITVPSWRPQHERSGPPWLLLAIVGGVLALAAIGGAVVWGLSKVGPRVVPIIEADSRPIKVRPTDAGGMVVPNQDQLVLEPPAARKAAERQQMGNSRLAAGPESPQLEALRQQARPAPPPEPVPEPPSAAVPSALTAPTLPAPVAPTAIALPSEPARPVGLPPPKATTVVPKPVAGGRAAVQLASLESEAAAQAEWTRVARKVPELAAFKPTITKVEREGQPTIFRLRAPGLANLGAALALCEAVKAKGAACLATGG